MPAYPFVETISAEPPVELYGTNISYEEILNSFVAYFYCVESLLIEASSMSQLNKPLSFDQFRADGTKAEQIVNPAVDPYQKAPAINVDLKGLNIVIDGQLDLEFDLQPQEWVRFTFYTSRVNTGYCAPTSFPSD